MSAFLAMGGYAAFVWPAYLVSVVGLAAMIAATLIERARIRKALARLGAGGN
ncbi:MAG: heme exporter protein CcmD [Alphaproteobacteria bacterium]|nr:heme exporter protein CcmD [Alphaproteobacteria bacterium]